MRILMITLCVLLATVCASAQDENMRKGLEYVNSAKNTRVDYNKQEYYKQAVPYLKAAVEEGFGEAAWLLGDIYWYGRDNGYDWTGQNKNRTYNMPEARRMFAKAIELGYDKGEIELGDMYAYGKGGDRDFKKAFELYTAANVKGQKEARYRLAMCYFYGFSIGEDEKKAYELSRDYLRKHHVLQYNPLEPDNLPTIAEANIYNMIARFCLNDSCFMLDDNGKEIKSWDNRRNWACYLLYNSRVVKWMYDAGSLMYKANVNEIGNMMIYGVLLDCINCGIDKDKAAKAYYMYADFSERFKSNYREMDSWLQHNYGVSIATAMLRAAEGGYAPAMQTIGDWYEEGYNVSKNLVRAKQWHDKAAAAGYKPKPKALPSSVDNVAQQDDNGNNNADNDNTVYTDVDEIPSFPGGMDGIYKMIAQNLRYPEEAAANGVEGDVRVRFILEKDGTLSNVEVVRPIDELLDREAVRVVKTLKGWEPAKKGGKPVRYALIYTVHFKLGK